MEASAIYSYDATSSSELSFETGAIVKILNEKDPDWYMIELDGQDGYAPVNYIQFNKPLWYRNVSKAEAVKLLDEKYGKTHRHPKGTFLVRPSESGSTDLSLSIKMDAMEHFKIVRENGEYFIWRAGPHFSSIDQLVEHYRQNSVSKSERVKLQDMKLKSVRVSYDYRSQTTEEMDINTGETITLFDDSDPDWWNGQIERDGTVHRGCFPANYVAK